MKRINIFIKKTVSILLFLLLVVFMIPIIALPTLAEECGDFIYEDQGVFIIIFGYTGVGSDIVIPDTIAGKPVIKINNSAFQNCKSLTSVSIPDSIISIGDYAFYNCTNLSSITIPNSISNIKSNTFSYCTSLSSITIPNSVTSIGDFAFNECTNLSSITIPNSVTSIGIYAFNRCKNLNSITIPSNIKNIGQSTFSDCTNLASVTMPSCVTNIGYGAFSGCTKLSSITIPSSLTNIDINAFYDCTSLSGVTIPSGVTNIGSNAFYNCISLTNINIDINNANYKSINGVLFNKTGTTLIRYPIGKLGVEYTIPNSVTSIDSYAFSYCTNLTNVTIPNSVTSMSYSAFRDCTNLSSIIIPSSVISIGAYAFNKCTNLSSITIPNSVTSIGIYAFTNCSNLKVFGILGSYAQQYTTTNNITFIGVTLPISPTVVSLLSKTDTTVNLSWSTVDGATSYNVYKNGVIVNSSPIVGTTYTVTGLNQNTAYNFTVSAENIAGKSAESTVFSVTTSPTPVPIASSIYTINTTKGYILGVQEGTSIAVLKSKISNPSEQIRIFYKNGTENLSNNIGTGMMVKLYNGNDCLQTLTVVIRGDVDGDGNIALSDLVPIRNFLLESDELSDAAISAGDLYGEGTITLNDLLGIKDYISEVANTII